MISTRPDLSYVVSMLSQHLAIPNILHFKLSKFVLKYLKSTKHLGLLFVKSNNMKLHGYSDSDWGGSQDRYSLSGYCFKMCDESSPVSWRTKKQNTIALSTCEAECISMTYAIQEGLFLKQLLPSISGNETQSFDLLVDNQGAMELAKNPVHHQRSKHIDIRYYYIRDKIKTNMVVMHYTTSCENFADILTKPTSKMKLNKFAVCI